MSFDLRPCIEHLFEFLRDCVIAEGGDGDAYVIAERHRELANLFAESESRQATPWFTARDESNDTVSFANDQEMIVFAASRASVPSFGTETLVELKLPWWVNPWEA